MTRPIGTPGPGRTRSCSGSALYRGFIIGEAQRIMRGTVREHPLTVPSRLLIGAEDPVVRSEFLGGYEGHADDLALEVVEGAPPLHRR
jgi:hypothetical protein